MNKIKRLEKHNTTIDTYRSHEIFFDDKKVDILNLSLQKGNVI